MQKSGLEERENTVKNALLFLVVFSMSLLATTTVSAVENGEFVGHASPDMFEQLAELDNTSDSTDKPRLAYGRLGVQYTLDGVPHLGGANSSGQLQLALVLSEYWQDKKTGWSLVAGVGFGPSASNGLGITADATAVFALGVPWAWMGVSVGTVIDQGGIDYTRYYLLGTGPALEFRVFESWIIGARSLLGGYYLPGEHVQFGAAGLVSTSWQW